MSLDWEALRTFLAIARLGGLAPAARALKVNHSTVFRRLEALEASLDTRLFDRHPRAYVLTAAGDALLPEAADVEERLLAVERRFTGRDQIPGGRVRVTTTNTLARHFLFPRLSSFRQRYSQITIDLITDNSLLDLARLEADIAVRGDDNPPDYLIGRRMGTVHWAPYVHRDLLDGNPLQSPWSELPIIGLDDSLTRVPVSGWLRRHRPDATLRLSDVDLVLEAVLAGLGVGWVPCFMVGEGCDLTALAPPDPALATGLWLLTHRDLRRTARVKVVMDWLNDTIRRDWPTCAKAKTSD